MLIDNSQKFVFVAIPKTGSTTVSIRFGQYEHPEPELYHMSIERCLREKPDYKNYFKFAFVRNPFERLVSAWTNFTDPKAGHMEWAAPLLEYVSFHNFIMDLPNSKWKDWVHFRPLVSFTHIDGENAMDFVGRHENFEHDLEYACAQIGVTPPPRGPHYRKSHHSHYRQYFNAEARQVVETLYKDDLNTYGYGF